MDFELTEEQKMVQQTARSFAQEVLAKTVAERDAEERFPYDEVKQMAELGFMGIAVPEEYNGSGLDIVSYAVMIEELAKVDASAAVVVSVNNSLVCDILLKFADDEQKEKYLKPLASGQKLGAFALSEAEAGSDPGGLICTAGKVGNEYILNGTKNFTTNGSTADVVIVFATINKEIGHKGICAFIVEKGTPGFRVSKKEKKMGIRSSDTCELVFEDCRVPKANLIGEEGSGFKIALATLDAGRIGIAAQALGIGQGALERAIQYANEREQFGKKIGEFQGVSFKLADMATRVEAARLLVYQAAWLKDTGKTIGAKASMAKMYASDTAMYVTTEAVQIHGGYGYIREYEVERMMRDAKITQIYEGTNEIQRLVISRHLLQR